jgi:hypothetical protein
MRRLLNFLGVIAMVGLVFALAPTSKAFAGKKATAKGQSSGTCGSDGKDPNGQPCNCPPQYAFVALGNGEAVDDFPNPAPGAGGCYDPGSGDPLLPDDEPGLACPNGSVGSALTCGCLLAGGDNPSPGTDVVLTGNAELGNWTITKLEVNFAWFDTVTDDFIGNDTGSGTGINGSRCYAAAGFLQMANTTGFINSNTPLLYLELQGTVCDTLVTLPEPQKFSFTGSYIVDTTRSSSLYANWSGTGTFITSISDATSNTYSPSNFSFNGYLLPSP